MVWVSSSESRDVVRASEVPELRGDPGRLTLATGWRPEIRFDQTMADTLPHWDHEPSATVRH